MASVSCVIVLVALKPGITPSELLEHLNQPSDSSHWTCKGRVHGWVHRPHHNNVDELLAQDWDVFLLSRRPALLFFSLQHMVSAYCCVTTAIPKAQYDELEAQKYTRPTPLQVTPPLPGPWREAGGIPSSAIMERTNAPLKEGELRLDSAMSGFLSNALPPEVANAPVSLMNLFRYPGGDSSTHDDYMEGFKKNFGDSAGATVKFMGPVESAVQYNMVGSVDAGIPGDAVPPEQPKLWQDANLVQYDSIWHYAYMLSTEVYAELNKQKVAGLEDTCILCVSEVELAR